MFNILPEDPVLCLSVVNTKLRDRYENLDALCLDFAIDKKILIQKLEAVDYIYDSTQNQFV